MKSRNELPELFVERGYAVGAEIGVWRGHFTERLCRAGIKMYGIDPWMPFGGQGRTQGQQENQDKNYEIAKKRLAPFDCTLIRKTSMDALADFKDGSLDFVYIDGDHVFRHVAADIAEWSKKVRAGGVVSGHDYWHTPPFARNVVCQVQFVVDAYVKTHEIKNLLITTEDKEPSWLWTKA